MALISTGGGGVPGGSTTQVQYNNAGAFGGTSGWTWDGTHFTMATTQEARFRASTNRLYSRAADILTLEGNVSTEVGKVGDIILGDNTLRSMYPQTTLSIDLGKIANVYNDCFVSRVLTPAAGTKMSFFGILLASADSYTVPDGYGTYIPDQYEVSNGTAVEVGAGSIMEIG